MIGPGESSLIATAVTKNSGSSNINAVPATTRSTPRLIDRSNNVRGPRCNSIVTVSPIVRDDSLKSSDIGPTGTRLTGNGSTRNSNNCLLYTSPSTRDG